MNGSPAFVLVFSRIYLMDLKFTLILVHAKSVVEKEQYFLGEVEVNQVTRSHLLIACYKNIHHARYVSVVIQP